MARPLQKTYSPSAPYVVERHDCEDGSITYEIWDERPDTYRRLCCFREEESEGDAPPADRRQAKRDADMIARALNAEHKRSSRAPKKRGA